MILIVSHPADLLAREVHRRLHASNRPVWALSETEFFTGVSFATEIDGPRIHGFLRFGDDVVSLSDINGVLMRLQHIWWPSADFDIQDQSFIYHETTAAWFTVLAGLKCRMVNRFGLSWWLRDQTYPILLAERLATCLGLQTTTANWTTTPHEPTWHSEHEPSNDVRVVYVIGKYIIPRRYSDRLLARDLIVKMDALARWQGETGATLSRITFQRGDHLRVKEVDIFPRLEQEEPDLLARVSAAVVSQWA